MVFNEHHALRFLKLYLTWNIPSWFSKQTKTSWLFSTGYWDSKQLGPLWSSTLHQFATVYMSCVKCRGSAVIFNLCIQHHGVAEPCSRRIHWLRNPLLLAMIKYHDCEKNSRQTRSPAILSLRFPFFYLPFSVRGQLSLSSFLPVILYNIMNLDNNLHNRKRAWEMNLNAKINSDHHVNNINILCPV